MEPLSADDPRDAGQFRLLARLGSGGMGQVFLGVSPAGRPVAVKVIHPRLARNLKYVSRFRNEVAAAQRVSGLYTAPVVAAGVDSSPLWLATAFVPGPSLGSYVTGSGPMPTAAAWQLAAGLAEALMAIHATGLIHRDLKPGNVLLALDGPRVIDFGLARTATDARLTSADVVIGTPAYMSPEQVAGEPGGPPADVFALGCVLAFATTAATAFGKPGMTAAVVSFHVMHSEPDLTAVPAQIRTLIASCLAKDPQQRPQPGQIAVTAARQASALGLGLGLSAARFWPAPIAHTIQTQQDAASATIRLLMGASPPAEADSTAVLGLRAGAVPPPAGLAAPALPVAPAAGVAPAAVPGPPALPEAPAGAPSGQNQPAGRRHAARKPADTSRRDASRRGFLIGAGAAGVVVAAGLAGWKLHSGPSRPADGGGRGGPPAGARHRSPAAGPGETVPAAEPAQPTLPQFAHLAPGQKAWNFTTAAPVDGNPTVAGGVVYVGSTFQNLYAVSVAAGKLVWSAPVARATAAPTVTAGIVCVTDGLAALHAIHAATGALAWQVPTTGALPDGTRSWAADGAAVITVAGRQLQVYDIATGRPGRILAGGTDFSGVMTAAGGILYAVDTAGAVHAIAISSGATLWHTPVFQTATAPYGAGLVAAGGAVYAYSSLGGSLYALDASTGQVSWVSPAGSSMTSEPAVAGGLVYIAGSQGLSAISAATGRQQWARSTVVTAGDGGLAAAGGQVYATAAGLVAVDARTGQQAWSFGSAQPQAGGKGVVPGSGSPAAADGLVFFGSLDKNLYAVRA